MLRNRIVIFLLVYLLILCSNFIFGQQRELLFQNIFSGKEVTLKNGDEVRLRFTVHDTADAPLDVAISDVTVTGTIESISEYGILMSAKNGFFDRASVVIPISSIEAFRKYSLWRPYTKAASLVAASAAGLLATLQISTSGEVVSWENAGLAVGASSALFMSKSLFSDKMKYYACEGWKGISVIKE